MNAKLGYPLWEVESFANLGKEKNFMYGALSLSKGEKGYVLAFVGTIDGKCTSIYSDSKIGIKKKE